MKLPKPEEGGGPRENPQPGTYMGTCIKFVDLGTQQREYMGEKKIAHEVMVTWELTDELMSDGKPFAMSKFYTWSMHEKANLRKDLESWRGKGFEPQDFDGDAAFNTRKLLGQPAMIGVMEFTKKNGEKGAKVDSVSKPMRGLTASKPVNPIIYFSLEPDEFDQAVYDNFSDGLKNLISKSPEFAALKKSGNRPVQNNQNEGLNAGADLDDDIPF